VVKPGVVVVKPVVLPSVWNSGVVKVNSSDGVGLPVTVTSSGVVVVTCGVVVSGSGVGLPVTVISGVVVVGGVVVGGPAVVVDAGVVTDGVGLPVTVMP